MRYMTKGKITEIDPQRSSRMIRTRGGDPDLIILDVRTAGEHEMARIEGSVNIDPSIADLRGGA
jgi:rhodanese-related sulfurtransferase